MSTRQRNKHRAQWHRVSAVLDRLWKKHRSASLIALLISRGGMSTTIRKCRRVFALKSCADVRESNIAKITEAFRAQGRDFAQEQAEWDLWVLR